MGWWANNFWWFRIKGTVLPAVWWQCFLLGIWSAAIVALDIYVPALRMTFPQTMITILGVVVSLLLAFRTNNAYDRYWEGRKLWTSMIQDVRKMTRAIWLGVSGTSQIDSLTSKALIERRSALNLSLAFVVAVKHYLRDEFSYDYPDLKDLVRHLPRFNTPSSNIPLDVQLKIQAEHKKTKMAFDFATPTNIPIEISYYYLSYVNYLEKNNLAQPWALDTIKGSLSNLVDSLCDFERILRTPIPLAYSIHLNQSVWLYILSIPFQIVGDLGWYTVPVEVLGSFCMLGILAIGLEIENPFGYDANDLPLDDFCDVIRREIEIVVGNHLPDAEEWMFSDENYPLGQSFPLSAKQLAERTPEEVLRILSKISSSNVGVELTSGKAPQTTSYGATGYQRLG